MASKRVVIVGGGFAGFETARSLLKSLPEGSDTEIVLINPTDYFLYLPLLPEVAAAVIDPRRVTVSLPAALPGVRLALGSVDKVDLDGRTVTYIDPEGGAHELGYDRLVLAAGSVNKLLPIPGVAEHAHGFRGVPEALYLRDHIIRQIELAAVTDDQAERDARCTFVVVGAGYTGTEVAAQGPLFTTAVAERHPELRDQKIRWLLLDIAPKVLPELNPRLSKTADKVLRARGVEVRMGDTVEEATADGVQLKSGEVVCTRSLVWCVGVRPDPVVEGTGLATQKGRVVVEPTLVVPGHPEVFACGDAAAVPDLTRPGEVTAMTAQHASRQGKLAGRNVVASLTGGKLRKYKHHDLGFVVDLGGKQAAANPLKIPLGGFPAKVVTRGYHLAAMPGNRVRTAVDWLLDAVIGRQSVQLGLVRAPHVPLDTDNPEVPRIPELPTRR
ncbi:NAD(P)/FAD-dependent oxidoreductase [Actinophytocola algeriensis]|uniref:NADH dehydrogenase n=1 Tax=Actinophytocola algeriensis TaxID=1768010 RepID=A0A7W7QA87_9PSEU|nr:NAD(P)/FAD-dependent oxidoreductase [Actinophytocola algeriensis]MBB4909864.1 NADH dehydrogenase [Actinophytocola algeriensis]MBE1475854.1 NADH dehydrogenase [Actinophytocola algeriensis]